MPNQQSKFLEFPTPESVIQTALQRSMDLVSYGLQIAQSASVSDLSIPGHILRWVPAKEFSMDPETARQEFRTWILANGFRDVVDSLGLSLEWARQTCFLWSRPGNVGINPDGRLFIHIFPTAQEWNEQIMRKAARFERLTLPDKFQYLENTYRLQLPTLKDAILSLNAARNCLTHRHGIVGQNDLKNPSDTGLTIYLRKAEVFATSPQGERTIENSPALLNAGEGLSVRFIESSRAFLLGERISFTPRGFMDVCTTFLSFAIDLNGTIRSFQDRRREELT
jgi:hypothetical protein